MSRRHEPSSIEFAPDADLSRTEVATSVEKKSEVDRHSPEMAPSDVSTVAQVVKDSSERESRHSAPDKARAEKPVVDDQKEKARTPLVHPRFHPEVMAIRASGGSNEQWDQFVRTNRDEAERMSPYDRDLRKALDRVRILDAHQQPASPEWADANKRLDAAQRAYGIGLIANHGLSVEDNLFGMGRLADHLTTVAKDKYNGKVFKPSSQNAIRPDGVIEINVNDPEFTNFLRTALKDQSLHDGVLDINPEGVRQETPIAPQEVTPEKSNLDKARDEFYKLQTELEQAQGKWGGFKAESRKRKESEIAELKTKFEAAEKNYKELRAEQVADDAEKALEESHKAADVMLEQYMNRSKTKTERGMELVDQKLKWIKSVPTKYKVAASFALLGVGLTGGVILAGTAFGARKIMSSASASAGTYGLLNSFKDYTQRKRIERDLKSQYPDNLEGHIAGMRIRARLDGKSTEDLKKDELYIQLVDKYRESFVANYEKDYGNRSQEVKARRLQEMLDQNNEALQKAKVTEKLWKRFNQVGSIVIGTAIGSGKVFELLNAKKEAKDAVASTGITSNVSGYFSESKPDLPPSPEMDVPETYKPTLSAAEAQKLLDEPVLEPEKTEILHNGNSTGASIESYRDSALVHVGNRGIEGSLIDLKSTQPERYAKMVSWLENRYPKLSGNEPGLIHRFVTEQAPDGKNLDRIMSAEVLIDKEGAITLDIDKVQFMRSPEINLGHGEGIRFNVTHAEAPLERVVIPDEPEIKPIHDVEWPKPHEFEEGEVTVKSMPATVEQAREIAAGSVEKTSDALQLVLSEKYKTFVERELHVSAKSLNKIKHLTYKEFLTSMNVSERFNKSFAGLAKFLADKEIKPNAKMHTALIELAKQWKYKN